MTLNSELQKLNIDGVLYFFLLEINSNVEPIRFHCNGVEETLVDGKMEQNGQMTFLGDTYDFVGIDQDGVRLSSGAKISEISLTVSNIVGGVRGYITVLCERHKDLIGAKLTIYMTTLAQMNNAVNGYTKQLWYIDQKKNETAESVEFNLSSPVDFGGLTLPTRIVFARCTWAMRGEYRGEECGYTGTKFFSSKGAPVSTIDQDVCGGCVSDCRLRFGRYGTLPFGGQPTAGQV